MIGKYFFSLLLLAVALAQDEASIAGKSSEIAADSIIAGKTTTDEKEDIVTVIHGEAPLVDWCRDSQDEVVDSGMILVEDSGLVYTLTSHFFKAYNESFMARFTE